MASAAPQDALMQSYACRPVHDFVKLERIGAGTYGFVFRAQDKSSGRIVALKKFRLKESGRDGFPLTGLREIKLLKRLKHPNIIHLLDIAVGHKPDSIFLVFEYCNRDFADIVDNLSRPFREAEVKCIMLQLLSAVQYLHDHFIIHRDLKLSNLLVDQEGQLRLADFGLARLCGLPLHTLTPNVATVWYRAPELLLGETQYHPAVDMWSVGCIMGELLANKPMLPGKDDIGQLQLIIELLGPPTLHSWPNLPKLPGARNLAMVQRNHLSKIGLRFKDICSPEGIDLLKGLLSYDPAQRFTAKFALEHPYFTVKPAPVPPAHLPVFPDKATEAQPPRKKLKSVSES